MRVVMGPYGLRPLRAALPNDMRRGDGGRSPFVQRVIDAETHYIPVAAAVAALRFRSHSFVRRWWKQLVNSSRAEAGGT